MFNRYWFERGFPQESKPFFKLTQTIGEASDERESEEVLHMLREAHNNHGTASAETNHPKESLDHNSIWLKMALDRRDTEGSEIVDYELGQVYNELGVAYAMNGRYDDAVESFMKSIDVYQSLDEYEDTWLGWPMPNLGLMHWVKGDYDKAEEVLQEIRQVYEDAFGEDDTQSFKYVTVPRALPLFPPLLRANSLNSRTGKILYALGNVYTSSGAHVTGFEYHLRCLRQYEVTLGAEHHRVGDACHRLADHCIRAEDWTEAQQYISRALEIFERRPYHRHELARSTFKEGQLYAAMGNQLEADKRFRKAFTLRRKLVPKDRRKMDELSEEDYDQMVIYWSR
jgi:tetratricopeptide (TPR) repeat protein